MRLNYVVSEERVEALRDIKLVLLQLGETADNERVFEVAGDAGLEKGHVVAGELGHALLQEAADAAVAGLRSVL